MVSYSTLLLFNIIEAMKTKNEWINIENAMNEWINVEKAIQTRTIVILINY